MKSLCPGCQVEQHCCISPSSLPATCHGIRDSIIAPWKAEGREGAQRARSWRTSQYPIAGTSEIAAEEVGGAGGSGVNRNASNQSGIPLEPGAMSAEGSTLRFAGLCCCTGFVCCVQAQVRVSPRVLKAFPSASACPHKSLTAAGVKVGVLKQTGEVAWPLTSE